jgi:hypothetical protein
MRLRAERKNHDWSYDFVFDQIEHGRALTPMSQHRDTPLMSGDINEECKGHKAGIVGRSFDMDRYRRDLP